MTLHFSHDRWQLVREAHRLWWAGQLDRPLILARVGGAPSDLPEPAGPPLEQHNCADFSITPEQLVERWDYMLSTERYLGDAFPYIGMSSFGPGIAGAFLGARLDNATGHVWFYPDREREVADLDLRYDPDNVWLRRVKAIYEAAARRWDDGLVQMAMTDLGGTLDVVSTFRPGEELLMDLLLQPEAVKRATWQVHDLWFRYFDELTAAMGPRRPGYSAWWPIYCETPWYILQCDFAYMIGPRQFDEFVLPELAAAARRLGTAIYHLDGVGQLPHLDSILRIPEIRGIQWVPGDGKAPIDEWPEVHRKVHAAGKLITIAGGPQTLERVADQIGTGRGISFLTWAHYGEEDALRDLLARYRL